MKYLILILSIALVACENKGTSSAASRGKPFIAWYSPGECLDSNGVATTCIYHLENFKLNQTNEVFVEWDSNAGRRGDGCIYQMTFSGNETSGSYTFGDGTGQGVGFSNADCTIAAPTGYTYAVTNGSIQSCKNSICRTWRDTP